VNQHLVWAWLILEIASAGVFLHAGIKFPYFVFFAKDKGLRPGEPPHKTMHAAMGLLAFLCIFLGVYPDPLYAILPYEMEFHSMYSYAGVVKQFQLLMFSALVFFLFLKLLKRTDTIALDTDWFWRKGGQAFYWLTDKSLNGINYLFDVLVVGYMMDMVKAFFRNAPQRVAKWTLTPFWALAGADAGERRSRRDRVQTALATGTTPVGVTALAASVTVFCLVLFILLK
jgi:multicomponent Na+:H+ antiporter subunit D